MNSRTRGHTTTWVYEQIRSQILGHKVAPGSKINQNAMAEEMKISRTPVVNALHKLESEGLVDNVPHAGFFVHQLTVTDLLDLFALREALDVIVVTELVATITTQQIDRLSAIFAPFYGGGDDMDIEAYRRADVKFHTTMLQFSRNDLAKRVNINFQILPRSFMAGLLRPAGETLPEHMAIVDALKGHDLERARQAATANSGKTRALLQEMIVSLRAIGANPENISVEEFYRTSRSA